MLTVFSVCKGVCKCTASPYKFVGYTLKGDMNIVMFSNAVLMNH